jgi:hypothetical protein
MTGQCDNNSTNNILIGFLNNVCSNQYTKLKKTYIVPQYLSLQFYDTKDSSNICSLCEYCWKNRYETIKRLYPNKMITDRIKLDFLTKVKPDLISEDTVYRKMKIECINNERYSLEEIKRGCSIMDIDNYLFL